MDAAWGLLPYSHAPAKAGATQVAKCEFEPVMFRVQLDLKESPGHTVTS